MIEKCKKCLISTDNNFKPCPMQVIGKHILWVGEAPGHTENRTKIPFTGKAGVKLREFLTYYDLTELSSFTNVIKCKPPRNREPLQYEVENCREYLLEDITEVKPKMIILLGRTAIESLTNIRTEVLRKYINKPIVSTGIVIIPIYHPSYIIRNQAEDQYFESFNVISDIYAGINKYYTRKSYKRK